MGFSRDGSSLNVANLSRLPVSLTAIDLMTGARTSRNITPRDQAGMSAITSLAVSHDGTKAVFSYLRTLSTLYEAKNLPITE